MTVLNDSKFMSQRILLKFKLRFGKTSEATVIEMSRPQIIVDTTFCDSKFTKVFSPEFQPARAKV